MRLTLPEDTPVTVENQAENKPDIAEDCLDISHLSPLEKFKYRWGQERAKWSKMNPAERLSYFWDYYKWYTFGFVVLVIFLVVLGKGLYENSLPIDLRIAILNADGDKLQDDAFTDAYRAHYDIPEKNHIYIFSNFRIDPDTYKQELGVTGSTAITPYEQLSAYVMSDYFDAIFMDQKGYDYAIEIGLIFSMTNIFPAETLAALEEHLVYFHNDIGERVPMAIDISGWKITSQMGLSYDKAYLTFPCNAEQNLKHAAELVEYILTLENNAN